MLLCKRYCWNPLFFRSQFLRTYLGLIFSQTLESSIVFEEETKMKFDGMIKPQGIWCLPEYDGHRSNTEYLSTVIKVRLQSFALEKVQV